MQRLCVLLGGALIAVASVVGCSSSGDHQGHNHGHEGHIHDHDHGSPTLAPQASGIHEGSGIR